MSYDWIVFYRKMAGQLASYTHKKGELFSLIKKLASGHPLLDYLHFDRQEFWAERNNELDPFTVMAIFNRGVSAEHRSQLARDLATALDVHANPPSAFHGIAHLDPRNSIFSNPEKIWNLFTPVLASSLDKDFCDKYDEALTARGNGQAMLTIAMFWCNPEAYMALDGLSMPFIARKWGLSTPAVKMNGKQYAVFLQELKEKMTASHISGFPELAFLSWQTAHGK